MTLYNLSELDSLADLPLATDEHDGQRGPQLTAQQKQTIRESVAAMQEMADKITELERELEARSAIQVADPASAPWDHGHQWDPAQPNRCLICNGMFPPVPGPQPKCVGRGVGTAEQLELEQRVREMAEVGELAEDAYTALAALPLSLLPEPRTVRIAKRELGRYDVQIGAGEFLALRLEREIALGVARSLRGFFARVRSSYQLGTMAMRASVK